MDAATYAGLQGKAPHAVCMLQINLPGKVIRLVDGSGFVRWNSVTFVGEDEDYGALDYIDSFSESEGTEAPRVDVYLKPKGNAALAAFTASAAQGSPVYIWIAVINPATGLLLGEPEMLFAGSVDSASVSFNQNSEILKVEVSSAWEYLFDNNEGQRWNDSFHRIFLWNSATNQRGFEHVVNVQRKMYWGYKGPNAAGGVKYNPGGGVYHGAGGSPGDPANSGIRIDVR